MHVFEDDQRRASLCEIDRVHREVVAAVRRDVSERPDHVGDRLTKRFGRVRADHHGAPRAIRKHVAHGGRRERGFPEPACAAQNDERPAPRRRFDRPQLVAAPDERRRCVRHTPNERHRAVSLRGHVTQCNDLAAELRTTNWCVAFRTFADWTIPQAPRASRDVTRLRCIGRLDDDDVAEILALRHLRELVLEGISQFPSALSRLGDLRSLTINARGEDGISELPNLAGLVALRTLRVRARRIAALPDSLSALRNLVELDVRHSGLRALPASLMELPKLRRILVAREDAS